MADELNFIVNVLANDEATAIIARLPVEVQAAVREVDAILSRGFGTVRGFQQLQEQMATGVGEVEQLNRAINSLRQASEHAFDIRGDVGRQLFSKLDELQNRALALRESLARPIGSVYNDVLLGGDAHLQRQSQELERILQARSDAAAIAAANRGTGSLDTLAGARVFDKSTYDAELAARQRQLELLQQEKQAIKDSNEYTTATNKERQGQLAEINAQIANQVRQVQDLKTAWAEYRAAAPGLPVPGAAGALSERVLGANDPRLALAQEELAARKQIVQELRAADVHTDQMRAALKAQITAEEQLLNLERQRVKEQAKLAAEAEVAARAQSRGIGGSHILNSLFRPEGGFGANFSRGFFGRQEDTKPLAEQFGQAAKFSILYGVAYSSLFAFAQALKEGVNGAIQFEQSLIELSFATGRSQQELYAFADETARRAAQAGLAPEIGPRLAAQAIGSFGLAEAPLAQQKRGANEAVQVATELARVSGVQDPQQLLVQLGGVTRAFNIGTEGLGRLGDAALDIGRKSGTSAADLVQAAAQIGELAKGAGFSLEETFAAISQIKTTTGKPAQTVASNLGQIFSRADQPALEAILRDAGVNTIGTTLKEQIQQLSRINLSQTQENQISAAFGRGAAGQAALALIHGFDQIERNAAGAERATGALNRAFEELQNSLGGRLATYVNSLKLLFIELAKTGVLDFFVAFLATTQPLINGLTDLVSVFNQLVNEGGTAARVVRDLVIALIALNAIGARTAAGAAAGGLLGRIGAGAGAARGVGGALFGGLAASPLVVGTALAVEGVEVYKGLRGAQDFQKTRDQQIDRSLPIDKQIEQIQAKIKAGQEANSIGMGFRAIGFATMNLFGADAETDRDYAANLMKQLDEAYAQREKELEILSKGGKSRAELFKQTPSNVQAAIADEQDKYSKLLQEANARGASPTEIFGLREKAFAAINQIKQDAKGATLDPTTAHDLQQALAVAGKELFDSFRGRVDQLVRIAGENKTSEQRDALEAEARRLLVLANGLRAENLPTKITSLEQLKKAIAAGYKKQQEQNRALLQNQIDLIQSKIELLKQQAQDATALLIIGGAEFGQDLIDAEIKRLNKQIADLKKKYKDAGKSSGAKLDPSYDGTGGGGSDKGPTDTAAQIAAAKNAANAFPGSRVEEAAAQIKVAAANLDAEKRGTVAYYNALRTLRQAQYEYAQVILEAQHVARQLTIDLTNPLAVAREELRAARAKLRSDLAKGAPQDVINQDKLAVQQAQNEAERTKFEQNLQQVQTNYDLGRITTAQYLAYLDSQADALRKIAHRTYQQQQELNELDRLIQEVQKSLQGQFNLGDIKLPSVYQVRQQVQGGAGVQVANVQNVRIEISGGDIAVIKSVVAQYLGPGAFSNAAISPPKI